MRALLLALGLTLMGCSGFSQRACEGPPEAPTGDKWVLTQMKYIYQCRELNGKTVISRKPCGIQKIYGCRTPEQMHKKKKVQIRKESTLGCILTDTCKEGNDYE